MKQILPLKGIVEIPDGSKLDNLQSIWNSVGGKLEYNLTTGEVIQTPGTLSNVIGQSVLTVIDQPVNQEFYKASWQYTNTKQLRGTDPWLVGWCVFDYVSSTGFKYIIVKPNGIEIGKVLGGDGQKFLFTEDHSWDVFSKRITVDLVCYGDSVDISVALGSTNVLKLQKIPTGGSVDSKVKCGMYTEDCVVTWRRMAVRD